MSNCLDKSKVYKFSVFSTLTVLFLLLVAPFLSAQDQAGAIIAYRKSVMKAIGGHTGALVSIVKGGLKEYQDNLLHHTRSIHEASRNVTRMFPQGTDSGKTRAKPEIWREWEAFGKAADELERESAKLVELAEAEKFREFAKAIGTLGRSCKGCHKKFRSRR